MQARMKKSGNDHSRCNGSTTDLAKASSRAEYQRRHSILFTRASQINGCSVCVDMGFRFKKGGRNNRTPVRAWLHGRTRHISRMRNAPRSRLPKPLPD